MTVGERPLRVGIACFPTFGGSGVVAAEIALALARRGPPRPRLQLRLSRAAWTSATPNVSSTRSSCATIRS